MHAGRGVTASPDRMCVQVGLGRSEDRKIKDPYKRLMPEKGRKDSSYLQRPWSQAPGIGGGLQGRDPWPQAMPPPPIQP